jgi:hypothetical protein
LQLLFTRRSLQEFMVHDRLARLYFSAPFFDAYIGFAFAGTDSGEVVARAFSVPFAFNIEGRHELPDGGWDEVIRWNVPCLPLIRVLFRISSAGLA